MTEQWRPVLGHEGRYEVSDGGRVRSLSRTYDRGGVPIRFRGRVLKNWYHVQSGYPAVALWKDNKQKTRYVHQLVLEAFVSPRSRGMETLHINGIPTDNRLANLRWGTHTENMQDKYLHGTAHPKRPKARKTHCPQGHEYNEVDVTPQGYHFCKECRRGQKRASQARRKWAKRAL